MKILCIGGAGCIGSHFVDKLIKENHEVFVYDDLSTGKIDYVNSKALFFEGDILSKDELEWFVSYHKPEIIYNFAIKPLLSSLNDPIEGLSVNVQGVINCCEIALKYGLIYIHISSSEVFGTKLSKNGMNENHPRRPTTPYGASKCAADYYVQAYHLSMGLKSIIIRPFNTYGPRMRMDGYCNVIYAFVKRLIEDKPPIIHGNGRQTRDLTYVSDIVNGIYLASFDDGLIGHSINIGSGEQISIFQIARLCNKYFDKNDTDIEFNDERFPNDVSAHECDYSRMNKRYRWYPTISFKNGLDKTIKWIVEELK